MRSVPAHAADSPDKIRSIGPPATGEPHRSVIVRGSRPITPDLDRPHRGSPPQALFRCVYHGPSALTMVPTSTMSACRDHNTMTNPSQAMINAQRAPPHHVDDSGRTVTAVRSRCMPEDGLSCGKHAPRRQHRVPGGLASAPPDTPARYVALRRTARRSYGAGVHRPSGSGIWIAAGGAESSGCLRHESEGSLQQVLVEFRHGTESPLQVGPFEVQRAPYLVATVFGERNE